MFVNFVVTKTGAIAEARVIKGLTPAFDAEALRLVQQMPAWQPARHNNQPVDCAYTLPITFSREPDAGPTKRKGKRRAAEQ